ncbi:MAG: ABC transporter permease [Saprospiraceae bacterium]|nr:ABC transporter permease [Saprospiraceae bacterium]
MIKNYIKLALRNLWHQRMYATLNIVGLAVGLAAGIFVLLWVADELRFNKFNTNLPNIHYILQNQTQGGVTYTFESTPGPLAAALRAEMPEVQHVSRASWNGRHLVQHGSNAFYERGMYAEPDFFRIFTHKAVQGDPVTALNDADAVVITQRTANKLFGNEDPLNKIIRHDNRRDLRVAAVIEDVPFHSSLYFDVVLPFRIYEQNNQGWINSWNDNSLPTWVSLHEGADLQALNSKLENFIQGKEPDSDSHIFAYPWSKWRLENKFEAGRPDGGRITLLKSLGWIGIFVLLLACINFMNLATARSERRAREVGVRKVMGAHRGLLIGQFLSEAVVMSMLGLALSILLVWLGLPGFNATFEKNIALSDSTWPVWAGILAIGLCTGLVAGSYPAFFLSKFEPVVVLKNLIFKGKNSNWLRKSLVTFQFIVSIALIICTLVLNRQIQHGQNRPIGYDTNNLIQIPARGDMGERFDLFQSELTNIPNITSVSAGRDNLINFGSNTSGIQWPGKTDDQDFLVTLAWVRPKWINTIGAKLLEGREFIANSPSDELGCLVNLAAVEKMGLKAPIVGSTLQHDTTYTILGVVENFVFNNPYRNTDPMVMMLAPSSNMSNFFVRFKNNDQWKNTIAQIEQCFKKVNPAYPFEYRFVKDEYQKTFSEMKSVGRLGLVFGGLAIFIAALGLFGLSAFVAERRKKEIGIRKVLGANIFQVCKAIAGEFIKPVLVAFIIAAPIAGWFMEFLLERFDYRIQLSWWMFAFAGVLALTIAAATVSFQSIKAALVNPVKSLRSE